MVLPTHLIQATEVDNFGRGACCELKMEEKMPESTARVLASVFISLLGHKMPDSSTK